MSDANSDIVATLKGRNVPWLVSILIMDIFVFLIFIFKISAHELLAFDTVLRAILAALLPIPSLILSSLISSHHKAVLVFWRLKHPLPGARAFSIHARADDRIDLDKLKENIGEFPVSEREQNSRWYSLYRKVQAEPAVIESHRNYLLFRDIAAMSLILTLAVPATLYLLGNKFNLLAVAWAFFAGQWFITALSARAVGIDLVRNVLAIHASSKVA